MQAHWSSCIGLSVGVQRVWGRSSCRARAGCWRAFVDWADRSKVGVLLGCGMGRLVQAGPPMLAWVICSHVA